MGLRGPAPKPTSLVILEGNRGRRPINDREPKPRAVRPKCPTYLDEAGQKEWKRLIPILLRMRILTEADGLALANLCQDYSTMKKAQAMLDKSGLIIKARSGYVQQSPLISIITTNMEVVTKLSREFGLTPASSRSLAVSEEKEDELAKILNAPREPRKLAIQ